MIKLNLPQFDYALKQDEGKVFILDIIRKKYLVLTPEEWVRQHFINYMITVLAYPSALIRVEGGLRFNQLKKRSDIVVYGRDGNPWMVVECKSPDHKLTQSTIQQASVYNYSLRAKYLAVTNGMTHICCDVDSGASGAVVLDAMPAYG